MLGFVVIFFLRCSYPCFVLGINEDKQTLRSNFDPFSHSYHLQWAALLLVGLIGVGWVTLIESKHSTEQHVLQTVIGSQNKLAFETSKGKWMGKYETNIETSFQQNNISNEYSYEARLETTVDE